MHSPNPPLHVVRFGVFELDTASGELRRHGLKIRLPDQSFQVLRLLLSRPGEVVTREELRRTLWTAETFGDFDVGLNSAIRRLREALDDSAENPRFVETLPRRGYRFVATVTEPAVVHTGESGTATRTAGPSRPGVRFLWIAGGLLLTATIAGFAVVYARGGFVRLRPGTAAAPIRSLVVLPFANLTGDATQDSFAEAVTDALTTHLAQVDGLDLISGTSARQYKRTAKRMPDIGKELNVDAALAGAVTRTGNRVRINAQLIHAATDRHLWARNYDRELSAILTLQQQIASDVAAAAGGAPAASAASRRGGRGVDPQAYEAYLKGTREVGTQRYERFRVAVAYFEEAVARQPDFAEAYAALAQTQVLFLFGGPLSPRQTMPKAEAAARKAVALDDTLAVAHRALGQVLTLFLWEWDEAEKEFQRAAALSGGLDEPSGAENLLLIRRGRFADALAQAERARSRDTLSFTAQMNVGTVYRAAGQHDQALVEFNRALAMKRDRGWGHLQLGITYADMNRIDDAIRELETAARLPRQLSSRIELYLGHAYARAGRPLDARRILNTLESRRREHYVSSFGIALIHDALGEKEPAITALERAYDDRAVELAQMSLYPPFKTIASDPRFQSVMRQVGLPR
jgi:TolB-like protein/DNA-binding winged helix-turn-helix (wHTH) protein/tetratricopeptide (TPR) repeat protein